MMAKILEAKPICETLKKELKKQVSSFSRRITLASVVVGKNYPAQVYLASQQRLAKDIGVEYRFISLKENVSQEEAVKKIKKLNRDIHVAGIIVNKPFPARWNEGVIFSSVDCTKDIEGVCPYNLGMLCLGEPLFVSPTALSVLELLKHTGINIYGKEIAIVGFSTIIGKPLALLLAKNFATVTITHIATYEMQRLPFHIGHADIVISAVGKPSIIRGSWIKKGSVIIDVGTAECDGKITGDIEFKEARKKALFITPVPGGVGRLTTVFLFKNLLNAVTYRHKQ
ncbi:MAG: bifunctional 5,10-methylenetetrahydrofolate dehydrogenase/5,10-methenyltetrahydrofolate cyclohydrolase [Candidatus Omnitrophica bacterium]|nr:bifunctional 5,10-methylenetetrahydrofolate dehydrogenase/5,10-methenyltetrahydrofolate cyclohydrolase [Candidatus Omnitrophota bacterium]